MAKNFITKVLTQIFQNQKGYRVQTSVHLKKIQQYLFDKGCPKLTNNDVQLLFLGIPDKKIMGMYALAGIKGNLSGLKKSSFYALEIVYKTLTTGNNSEICSKYFCESDQEDFKLLRLATHISQEKSNIALELCAIIKDKRPYLSQNNYLYSEQSKQKFKKWYKQRPKPKRTQVKKKTHPSIIEPNLHQQKTDSPFKTNFQETFHKKHSNNQNISTNLQQLQFMDFDILGSEEQYYLDTFLDPLDIWQYKQTNKQERQRTIFQQYMKFLIQTPFSRVDPSLIEDRIMSIHMQSPEFVPAILLDKYHKNMSDKQKHSLGKQIPHYIGTQAQKNLVKYFFTDFITIEHKIGQIKNNFDQSDKIRNEGNIGFSLRTKTKNSMKHLSSKVEPLHYKYMQAQKIRKLIVFLQQNSQFTKLASTFQSLIQQNKINNIPQLYSRYSTLLDYYREKPIIGTLIQNIESNLMTARIKQIHLSLYPRIQQNQCDTLLGLFHDKKQALKNYIVPKIIHNVLYKLPFRCCEENKKDLLSIQNKIKQFQLLNFRQLVPIKKISLIGDNIEQGDLLQYFLNKGDQILDSYYGQCQAYQKNSQQDLLVVYKIVQEWQIKYNLYFDQKQLLNKIMLACCNSLTHQINQTLTSEYTTKLYEKVIKHEQVMKEERCVQIICRILLLIQKFVQNHQLIQKMQDLKLDNFQLFCKLLALGTKSKIDFKPCPIRRNFDKQYYNEVLVTMMGEILSGCNQIKKYPSFINCPYPKKYQQKAINYICECFEVDDIILTNLPQILTYACVVNAIIQDKFLDAFYYELKQFPGLKIQLRDSSKKRSKRVKQLLNSYIKISYTAIIFTNKYQNFSMSILNTLNDHMFLISEYAYNNYKNLARFFMESFLNQCEKLNSDKLKQGYFGEMFIIKSVTTNICSKRIDERWSTILSKQKIAAQKMQKLQNQVFKLKYKNNITFRALIE